MKSITEISEMKQIQLDIMRSIHRFCKDNHIQYFLSHGSLLGAVRHNGFIPWDDDIDIFMPREDYERFCILFPQNNTYKHLKIANSNTKPFYARPMSKIYDNRTVLVEPNYVGDDPLGVNIDIWPLDGVPDKYKEKKIFLRKIKILQKILYGRVVKMSACNGILQKTAHFFLMPLSAERIVKTINGVLQKYKYQGSDEVICAVDPYKRVYKKEWFEYGVLAEFEGEHFYIPNGSKKILTEIYGDYMKLPPENERNPHHVTNAYWREK